MDVGDGAREGEADVVVAVGSFDAEADAEAVEAEGRTRPVRRWLGSLRRIDRPCRRGRRRGGRSFSYPRTVGWRKARPLAVTDMDAAEPVAMTPS